MRLRFLLALAGLVFLFTLAPHALAQSPIAVTSSSVDIQFPREMAFKIQASSPAKITAMEVTVYQQGVGLGSRFSPNFTPSTNVSTAYHWDLNSLVNGGYLPPGTHGEYTWHIEDAAGNTLDTPHQPYTVEDRTQKWQTLSNDNITIKWYGGDQNFGNAVFQRAVGARDFFSKQLGISNIDPLQVYIYADRQDFFGALPPFSAEWTGGRTFPEYGVIMINFDPSNLDWGLRATSHELSHAVLHAKIKGTIGELSIPHWLDEGLAVYNETTDHAADPQFEQTFQNAVRRNALISLRNMELEFPNASNQAELAYGESYNVVKFIIDTYGQDKFADLLSVFEKGSQPDDAFVQVYGLNQDQIDNTWRAKLNLPPRSVLNSTLPTVAPRPTYALSSGAGTDVPSASVNVTATPAPTRIAAVVTPVPAASIPAQTPAVPTSGLCGGILGLGGLILFGMYNRRKI